MHTSERISKFYDDLESLGLKFPVAELSKKLKKSKGYVSDVLNRKKNPSEEFMNDFYRKFSNSSLNALDEENYELPLGELRVTLKDYVDLLKEQNRKAEKREEEYLKILNSSLVKISNSQQVALAYQKAWVDHNAERESGGNPKKKKELVYKMGKLVDDMIEDETLKGTLAETRK